MAPRTLEHARRRTYVAAAHRQLARLRPGPREMPSYFIVGAKRAGTTSLHDYIIRHPDVMAPLVAKGCRYFDVNFDRGWDWFCTYFPHAAVADRHERQTGRRPIVGESSPYYAFHLLAPNRIHDRFPDARLIFLLRDPVTRTWSHYNYERARGHESLSFDEALDREEARLAGRDPACTADQAHRHFAYKARSRYLGQVLRLYRLFGREQVLALPSEQLFDDPQVAMDRVFSHLGLEPWQGDFSDALKANQYAGLPDDVRDRLVAEFAADNRRLYDLLGTDLNWLT